MKVSILFSQILIQIFLIAAIVPTLYGQQFGRNKVQHQTFDFKEIRTDHFRILYYDEMRPFMPEIARMSERWYERISQVSGHEFSEGDRKPLIFYADDADFRQTNIVPGFIPGGVRGLAEPVQERVVMPLTPNHRVTHQVLGHELVHSFQYDFSRQTGINIFNLPLWLVEGMAEYYSIGRQHTETAMWMRDAVLNDRLPSMSDLSRYDRFNPYRYGQALLAYIGGTYGDETVIDYFRTSGRIGTQRAVDSVMGISSGQLIENWHHSLREHFEPQLEGRTPIEDIGRIILSEDQGHGRINVSPSISPDGRYLAYLSQQFPVGIDLLVADTETGEQIANLGSLFEEPHLDDLRFLTSGGSWDPESRRLAFITFSRGRNEIAVWNISAGRIERTIRIPGAPSLENPVWSPDGTRIAVSGVVGATSNIYVYNLETRETDMLTDDIYSALMPDWSPDGSTIAFTTDAGPGGTNLEQLDIRPSQIALLNVDNGNTTYLSPFGQINYSNPKFSPDGESLYFIAAPDGFLDIFRYEIDSGNIYRLTRTQTGIIGITIDSPALTVARETGELMFSIFSRDRYSIAAIEPAGIQPGNGMQEELTSEDIADLSAPAGVLPPYQALGENIIAGYLADPGFGLLPADTEFDERDHGRTFRLVGVLPPQLGIGFGGIGGTQVAGGAGLLFADLLNDRDLAVALGIEVRGQFSDFNGLFRYINRRHRINYGGIFQRSPQTFATAFLSEDPDSDALILNRLIDRVAINQAALLLEYPLSVTRRVETSVGVSMYQFDRWVHEFLLSPSGHIIDDRQRSLDARDNIYFASGTLAYVTDTSYFGFTSPVQGTRFRLQASPFVGNVQFLRLSADLRQYQLFNPFSLAFRVAHHGNYWADFNDPFSTEYLGYPNTQTYIRGYDFFTFRAREFDRENGENANFTPINRLAGTHVAVSSMELRLPIFGTEHFGLFRTRVLPVDIGLFVDGGLAWTNDDPPVFRLERDSDERIPVFSMGVTSRFNMFGMLILEIYLAHPFQRPERGTHLGFQLIPGW